jgi:CheY-like chemotaxis protein
MKKILVVDDEKALRGLFRRRLSAIYEIYETGDPEEALALALEHRPDAIFLDLRMPKFDGFELCRNFRSLSHTSVVPIFVITGSGNFKEEFKTLGAAGYFEKPIDFTKLKETLAVTLGTSTAEPRQIASLKMRVAVKLQGTDATGKQFIELAETDCVSRAGFHCVSTKQLTEGSPVKVFLTGTKERYIGLARVVKQTLSGLQHRRYQFDFEQDPKEWIVQKT